MSTKSKNTKDKSRVSLEMEIGFSKEQKDILEKMMKEKISECVDNIMNSDSEGGDFEGDRDSFNNLFEKVFSFKSLKEEENVREKKMRKSKKMKRDPNMPKKNKTPYFMWLWNKEEDIGISKIKNDFPELIHKQALSKAGQIWNEMTEEDKQVFNDLSFKDKERYEKQMFDYLKSDNIEDKEEIHHKKKSSLTNIDMGEVIEEELDGFERKVNNFLYGYTKKNTSTKYNTLNDALSALQKDEEATGIVKDNKGVYTIRKGKLYKDTPQDKQPQICWKKL